MPTIYEALRKRKPVETAKKTMSHDQKAKKLSAVVSKMGISAGEWEKLSEKVFRLAFGKKA